MGQDKSKSPKHFKQAKKSDKLAPGILKQPSEDEFNMSDEEKQLLEQLFNWGERSKNTPWILGQPLGFRSNC